MKTRLITTTVISASLALAAVVALQIQPAGAQEAGQAPQAKNTKPAPQNNGLRGQGRAQGQNQGGNGNNNDLDELNTRDFFRRFFGDDSEDNNGNNNGNKNGNKNGNNNGQRGQAQGGGAGEELGQRLMEEMLKRMGQGGGQQPGPGGQRQFRFKFGPNGMEQDNNAPQGGRNPLEALRGMLGGGMRGHEYDPSTAPHDSKYSRSTLSEYRSCIKEVRPSTVAILKQEKAVALGSVVTADGYIITKLSELGKGDIECEFMDGKILPAKILHKLEQYDLALIKVDAKDLKPVKFKTDDIGVGTMLVAAGIDENPVSVGVLSVPVRNMDDSQKGFVGVGLKESPKGKGVVIQTVVENGPGEKAGLEINDTVLAIDGTVVNHPHELMRLIAAKGPGEVAKLNVAPQQGGDPVDVEVTLGSREDMKKAFPGGMGVDPTAQMGSDLSNKAANFPNVLQNDLGINADQCGGPVVDIDGNVVGVNIARSGRISTLMLSGKIMQGLLADVTAGKLTLVKDAVTMDKDIKKAEAALKAAQDTLNEAMAAKAKAAK